MVDQDDAGPSRPRVRRHLTPPKKLSPGGLPFDPSTGAVTYVRSSSSSSTSMTAACRGKIRQVRKAWASGRDRRCVVEHEDPVIAVHRLPHGAGHHHAAVLFPASTSESTSADPGHVDGDVLRLRVEPDVELAAWSIGMQVQRAGRAPLGPHHAGHPAWCRNRHRRRRL